MKKLLTFLLLLFSAVSSFGQLIIEGNGQKISLPAGTYTLKVGGEEKPPCGCDSPGWNLLSIDQKSGDLYTVAFNACNVNPFDWKIQKDGKTLKTGTVIPTGPRVDVNLSGLADGGYEMLATSANCEGAARLKFEISHSISDRTNEGAVRLTPLRDPLLPNECKSGNYVLRYVESRPDDHLDLKIEERNGQLYLSDVGTSLQSANYTLNGWSDPENAGKLENEAIQPYTLYHVVKYSIDAPIRDWWRSMYAPRANAKRSELFFYVVPQSENWNPAGDSNNPIGRPAAFAKIPAFKLKNRVYGFEYDFKDESGARLDDLDITFNRKQGKKHLKLYSGYLSDYLRKLPVRKGFEDLTESECIDFANSLPIELIVAFDIEPGQGSEWMINYDGPNFGRNMGIVIERLKERGALAYNWLDIPSQSPNVLTLDNVSLNAHGNFGSDNAQIGKYKEAYSRIGDIQKRYNPYSVISTGYGYNSYDYNLSPTDGNGQNLSPQLTYLKSLDASELWGRVFSDKDQVYFSWPFMEFDGIFPQNHVVEIPEFGARARRTDNKTLYAPSQWQDNLTLGLLRSKYLFYWSPGPVGWNPANVSSYNNTYTNGFSVWTYEKGKTPETGRFYIGKEAMAVNATIKAAYQFSLIQDATDGKLYAPSFSYSRAAKDGSRPVAKDVPEIVDGSWYVTALMERRPFTLIAENNGKSIVFFQDVFARPGRFTKFQFVYAGKTYEGVSEGNRLFIAYLKQ
ncbi:hypothetical protein [Runella slithyformis]|uniref:Uncharacterized protein n=1 Tax=Runella slithyformis (strain ATCC 29530 / DSM 19594 / LMG 11500 / NCIMB 11436 / LSU 4) TaxID=761193 RepID=A0A7U3ZI79_RUNSL|nr:hypothetical protein [Runella slithyformis]AEI47676.1 hypothetical protein Runsl_1249 [Runella slithyformis DSM 19594]